MSLTGQFFYVFSLKRKDPPRLVAESGFQVQPFTGKPYVAPLLRLTNEPGLDTDGARAALARRKHYLVWAVGPIEDLLPRAGRLQEGNFSSEDDEWVGDLLVVRLVPGGEIRVLSS